MHAEARRQRSVSKDGARVNSGQLRSSGSLSKPLYQMSNFTDASLSTDEPDAILQQNSCSDLRH